MRPAAPRRSTYMTASDWQARSLYDAAPAGTRAAMSFVSGHHIVEELNLRIITVSHATAAFLTTCWHCPRRILSLKRTHGFLSSFLSLCIALMCCCARLCLKLARSKSASRHRNQYPIFQTRDSVFACEDCSLASFSSTVFS